MAVALSQEESEVQDEICRLSDIEHLSDRPPACVLLSDLYDTSLRNGSIVNSHSSAGSFFFLRRRSSASPTFFALHKEKITAYKNDFYYRTIP